MGTEPNNQEDAVTHHRLMLRSMIEDGELARLLYEPHHALLDLGKSNNAFGLDRCRRGTAGPVLLEHSVSSPGTVKTIMVSLLPAIPIVDYGMPREKLVEQVVWFTLRGLGVRDEAIERYYNPEALTVLMA